ncbi:MAG: DUF445 family protein [Flammeovirgaceae bacterium]
MEYISLITIPLISGAIGWFTNWVAIKMLFRPRQERNYYLFKLHGIFPKRKKMLAERLGKIVAKELFSMDMVVKKVDTEENREQLKVAILSEVETFIRAKIKSSNPLIAMFATENMISQLLQSVKKMLDDAIPKMIGQLTNKLEEVDIEKAVYNRVMNFSDEKFEGLLMAVIQKELGFIEVSGAVLGFLVGVLQSLIVWIFQY